MPTSATQLTKPLKALGAALVLAVGLFTVGTPAQAQMATTEAAVSEMSIGSPDAPLTLYEYSSLTCPHCANFHTETLPKLQENYIDTGKLRIVFNDFPLGNLAFAAAMIARCAGPERHFELFDRLYHTQSNWAQSDAPRDALVAIARFSGLSSDDVTACLENNDLAQSIQLNAQNAQELYQINSTPTFILNGKKIEGALPYEDFAEVIDNALEKMGAN